MAIEKTSPIDLTESPMVTFTSDATGTLRRLTAPSKRAAAWHAHASAWASERHPSAHTVLGTATSTDAPRSNAGHNAPSARVQD
jgi:hypothetical protein